jgi:hypothetical protein
MDDPTSEPEAATPPPAPPPTKSNRWSEWNAAVVLCVVVTLGAWAWTTWAAFSEAGDVDDIANDAVIDASAVQISQIADQAIVSVMPLFALSLALTALTVFVLGGAALARLTAAARA